MSDGKVHIRDIMMTNMDSMEEIRQVTMCEIQHSNGHKLIFGVPSAATCEKCIRRWNDERDSLKDESQALHRMRKSIHAAINSNPDTQKSKHWGKAGK